jgi:hypothetical protein
MSINRTWSDEFGPFATEGNGAGGRTDGLGEEEDAEDEGEAWLLPPSSRPRGNGRCFLSSCLRHRRAWPRRTQQASKGSHSCWPRSRGAEEQKRRTSLRGKGQSRGPATQRPAHGASRAPVPARGALGARSGHARPRRERQQQGQGQRQRQRQQQQQRRRRRRFGRWRLPMRSREILPGSPLPHACPSGHLAMPQSQRRGMHAPERTLQDSRQCAGCLSCALDGAPLTHSHPNGQSMGMCRAAASCAGHAAHERVTAGSRPTPSRIRRYAHEENDTQTPAAAWSLAADTPTPKDVPQSGPHHRTMRERDCKVPLRCGDSPQAPTGIAAAMLDGFFEGLHMAIGNNQAAGLKFGPTRVVLCHCSPGGREGSDSDSEKALRFGERGPSRSRGSRVGTRTNVMPASTV